MHWIMMYGVRKYKFYTSRLNGDYIMSYTYIKCHSFFDHDDEKLNKIKGWFYAIMHFLCELIITCSYILLNIGLICRLLCSTVSAINLNIFLAIAIQICMS